MSAALIPSNRAYTEFQAIVLDCLAWAEKKKNLVERMTSSCELHNAAAKQFRSVQAYAQQFLRAIPRSFAHPGFLAEVRDVLGGSTLSFAPQREAEGYVKKYLIKELAAIVIQYYDPKEPMKEDVLAGEQLILRPDMTSATVQTRIALLISNYEAGLYNSRRGASPTTATLTEA